jgi:hypothetical protein
LSSNVSESTFDYVQLYVFRSSGYLDAYATNTYSPISVSCSTGTNMEIYALVNAPTLNTITKKSELLAATTSLSDNGPTSLVMVGGTTATISSSTSVTIPVTRIVARLSIAKITNSFSAVAYQSKSFVITKIYAINVAGSNNYGLTAGTPATGDTWYNKMGYSSNATDAMTYEAISGGTIAYGSSNISVHYFYVYPNGNADSQSMTWSARYTRLVIEATLDGTTYYYPIDMPSLESNKKYDITELVITRPGSFSPDTPVATGTLSATISISDWITGDSKIVTI